MNFKSLCASFRSFACYDLSGNDNLTYPRPPWEFITERLNLLEKLSIKCARFGKFSIRILKRSRKVCWALSKCSETPENLTFADQTSDNGSFNKTCARTTKFKFRHRDPVFKNFRQFQEHRDTIS